MYEALLQFIHLQNSIIMKRNFILLLAVCFAFVIPLRANTIKPRTSANQLRKEVASFFKSKDLSFLDKSVEVVNVSFMINAKNELVIFNVSSDDPDACDYVKKALDFRQVSYTPDRPMAKFAVDIRLVRT